MNRLQHSLPGFLRLAQIGAAALFAVTEGRIDRLFFAAVLEQVTRATRSHIRTTVHSARELPNGSGGKQAALVYYEYLRRRNALVSTLGGKTSVVVFFLDKDLDDLTRRRKRSQHVIYTEYFDVESYLYRYGDVVVAASMATTLDASSVRASLDPVASWTVRASSQWSEWVSICVLEITYGLPSTGNYSICPSPIHSAGGVLVADRLEQRLALIERNSGLTSAEFRTRWDLISRRVVRIYRAREGDRVFKGKWYSWMLSSDLLRACRGRDAELARLEQRLPHHLLQTLDFAADWSARLRTTVANLLDRELPAT